MKFFHRHHFLENEQNLFFQLNSCFIFFVQVTNRPNVGDRNFCALRFLPCLGYCAVGVEICSVSGGTEQAFSRFGNFHSVRCSSKKFAARPSTPNLQGFSYRISNKLYQVYVVY